MCRSYPRARCGLQNLSCWGGSRRLVVLALLLCLNFAGSPVRAEAGDGVPISALGRIEPREGITRLSGPAGRPAVIASLEVDEGERVAQGDVIAVLDDESLNRAEVARMEAELAAAQRSFERAKRLKRGGVSAAAEYDNAELAVAVLKAQLERANAQLGLSIVRAPFAGQVLEIHARRGERVSPKGIAELARTDEMYAIAEVYETDIRRVRVGQAAEVSSPALSEKLMGKVERIGLKIGKLDVLSTDPAAKTDARVVEVEIRLDDSRAVAALTNLQVTVEIRP